MRPAASWCRGSISVLPRRSNIARSSFVVRVLPLLQANGWSPRLSFSTFFCRRRSFSGPCSIAMCYRWPRSAYGSGKYFSAAVGTGLALAYSASLFAVPAARSPSSAMYLALVIFCINGLGFGLAALTPLSPRYAGIRLFYKQNARRIVIVDMHLTTASLTFPLAVLSVGAIWSCDANPEVTTEGAVFRTPASNIRFSEVIGLQRREFGPTLRDLRHNEINARSAGVIMRWLAAEVLHDSGSNKSSFGWPSVLAALIAAPAQAENVTRKRTPAP